MLSSTPYGWAWHALWYGWYSNMLSFQHRFSPGGPRTNTISNLLESFLISNLPDSCNQANFVLPPCYFCNNYQKVTRSGVISKPRLRNRTAAEARPMLRWSSDRASADAPFHGICVNNQGLADLRLKQGIDDECLEMIPQDHGENQSLNPNLLAHTFIGVSAL